MRLNKPAMGRTFLPTVQMCADRTQPAGAA